MNDEKSKRWPVLFLGHDADKDTPGTFVWKLRDELKEACKEYNIEKWLNIAPFDMEEFKKALKAYKKEFTFHIGEEIYKWKAIKQFQDNWNIDAENFPEMLDKSFAKTANLLANNNNYPLGMLKDFCKVAPEDLRIAFRKLYDENTDIVERINNFISDTDKIRDKHNPEQWKNTFQSTNAISTYLWLRYPDKYVIYKYSEIEMVSTILRALYEPEAGSVESLEEGFNLYNLLSDELRKDEELLGLLKKHLTDDCYSDPEYKTLAIDFGFFISRYYHKNWIVPCNPNDYDIDGAFNKFNVINWKQAKNYSVGDYIYIYVSGSQKHISYKAKVTKINVPKAELINDAEFVVNDENYKDSKKMEIELVDRSNSEELNFSELKKHGLKSNLQSSIILTSPLLDYINSFFTEDNLINEIGENAMDNIGKYKDLLVENKNLILHGAPGTGKTHLAKDIATRIILNKNYTDLTEDERESIKEQIGFVQFHPSYDYTDFVEGLRPVHDENDDIGFERRDGVFKIFCKNAIKNLRNSEKDPADLQKEITAKEVLDDFLSQAVAEQKEFKTSKDVSFYIKSFDESHICIMYKALDGTLKDVEKIQYSDFITLYNIQDRIERSEVKNYLKRKRERQADTYSSIIINYMKLEKILQLLEEWKDEKQEFKLQTANFTYSYLIKSVTPYEITVEADVVEGPTQQKPTLQEPIHTFDPFSLLYKVYKYTNTEFAKLYIEDLYNRINKTSDLGSDKKNITENKKEYVFIIDEINRGELSKIFGELFYSIDPEYRGLNGRIQTQYQNLIEENDEFFDGFYIPENVYIIGTMNDIDRSVESMDFAMRRRFIFEEVTAEESAENMNLSSEAKERMKRINDVIEKTEGLNDAYKIGGAYFLNADDFDKLWRIKLSSLIKEYLRGIDDDGSKYKKIEDAYFNRPENDFSDNDE